MENGSCERQGLCLWAKFFQRLNEILKWVSFHYWSDDGNNFTFSSLHSVVMYVLINSCVWRWVCMCAACMWEGEMYAQLCMCSMRANKPALMLHAWDPEFDFRCHPPGTRCLIFSYRVSLWGLGLVSEARPAGQQACLLLSSSGITSVCQHLFFCSFFFS